MNNDLYKKINNNTLSLQGLSDAFSELIPSNITDLYDINLVHIEAYLLHFYNNTYEHRNRTTLFDIDTIGKDGSLNDTSALNILVRGVSLNE